MGGSSRGAPGSIYLGAMEDQVTRCIECGGFVDSLNEDEDGVPCPACAERLLESLPGIFHSSWGEPEDLEDEVDGVEVAERTELAEAPAPRRWRADDDAPFGPDQPA